MLPMPTKPMRLTAAAAVALSVGVLPPSFLAPALVAQEAAETREETVTLQASYTETEIDPIELRPNFIRLTRDREGEVSRLQTAIAHYTLVTGEDEAGKAQVLEVDLIGAVHIGDRSYYKDLQEAFEEYDVLLYELVKPEGGPVPDGQPVMAEDPISMLMDLGMGVLNFDSQTDHIDYTRPNFVHADMSPEQMAQAIAARGDDAMTVALSMVADVMRQQNLAEQRAKAGEDPLTELPMIDPLELLVNPDAGMVLKRFLAEQIARDTAGGLGPTLDTILIDDRNAACMRVFQKELAKGRKKIGIFYGAAHLPDFDRRLRDDFGLVRTETRWVTAWDMR